MQDHSRLSYNIELSWLDKFQSLKLRQKHAVNVLENALELLQNDLKKPKDFYKHVAILKTTFKNGLRRRNEDSNNLELIVAYLFKITKEYRNLEGIEYLPLVRRVGEDGEDDRFEGSDGTVRTDDGWRLILGSERHIQRTHDQAQRTINYINDEKNVFMALMKRLEKMVVFQEIIKQKENSADAAEDTKNETDDSDEAFNPALESEKLTHPQRNEPPLKLRCALPRKASDNYVRHIDNWILYTFFVEPGSMNVELGCVLRTGKHETDITLDAVTVERINNQEDVLKYNEELVSNIIKLSQTDPIKEIQLKDPITLTIPHCAPRNMRTRETVIKRMEPDGDWKELPTKAPELRDEDFKEYDFVETLLTNVNTTLAVITRIKKQSKWIPREGAKLTSVVDRNVSLEFKPDTFEEGIKVTIQVEAVETSDIAIAKMTKPECDKSIVSSTPIVTWELAIRKLDKPVTVTLPIPRIIEAGELTNIPKVKVNRRPFSASPGISSYRGTRDDTDLHLLTKSESQWSDRRDIPLTAKKGLATFKVPDRAPEKFAVLRTGPGTTQAQAVEAVTVLENSLGKREIRIIMGQNSNIPQEFIFCLVPKNNTDQRIQEMKDNGYQTNNISNPIVVREGQQLHLEFTGNITQADEQPTQMHFHSHATGGYRVYTKVVDMYAQKGRDDFDGHALIYTNEPTEDYSSDRKKQLCQFVMQIPKPPRPRTTYRQTASCYRRRLPDHAQHTAKPPPPVIEDDTLPKEILQVLSMELSENGGSNFVEYLEDIDTTGNVRKATGRGDSPHNLFHIIVVWLETLRQSEDKVANLCQVLHNINREDLVELLLKKL